MRKTRRIIPYALLSGLLVSCVTDHKLARVRISQPQMKEAVADTGFRLPRQITWTDDKGKEHIVQFAPENWFVTDRESVFFNQKSSYFIQALENSSVLLLDEAFILLPSQKNNSFIEFNNKLLHNHIRHLQKRITQLLGATAEERYLDFIKIYPDLLLRVSQAMVASYLGITPESLSRVRKELSGKNHTK